MMHRGYMRKGVSLEVIVEEDDNTEVSLDPVYRDESDSSPSSPTLSMENEHEHEKCSKENYNGDDLNDVLDHTDRLRQEKEKRRKQKEEERWQNLERQRSLSCETLTILDVGDDEFSREQWEVETRDWDSENSCTRSEIEHSISRKKILASRLEYQDKYDDDYPSETRNKYDPDYPEETRVDNEVDEVEMENGRCWNPDKATEGIEEDSEKLAQYAHMEAIQEDKDETNGLEEEEEDKDEEEEDNLYDDKGKNDLLKEPNEERLYFDIELNQNYNTFTDTNNYDDASTSEEGSLRPRLPSNWLRDPFANGEDSWITVGDLVDDTGNESDMQNHINDTTTSDISPPSTMPATDNSNLDIKTLDDIGHSPKTKHKEVRFSEQLEFVHEQLEEKSCQSDQHINSLENEQTINDQKEEQNAVSKTSTKSEILQDNLVSVKAGRHLFESKSVGRTSSPLAERLSTVLETPDIMIVERANHSENDEEPPSEKAPDPEVTHETTSPTYNVHNIELNPKELPPPHTVASVRQLFEKLPTFTLRNVVQYNLQTRYDHVRSNPTSKILRFDRHEHSSTPVEKPKPKPKLAPTEASVSPERQNRVKITPEMIRETQKRNYVPRPPEDYSTTGVHLRKPQLAHGFDVQKALRENPRYFHIRIGERVKKDDKRTSAINTSNPKGKRNTVTYSYLEAKQQPHSGATTSLRWTKESVDRSDSESMSSESSEDSGVSRDFTSSIISSFSSSKKKKPKWRDPNLTQEEYGSDPSFKWIDPSVLAKIRARGTTVIYFGPRHRPQDQSRSPRRYREHLPSFEDINELPTIRNIVGFDDGNIEHLRNHDAQYDKEDYVAAYTRTPTHIENVRPKIVGVTHKKDPNSSDAMSAIPSKTCNNKNQFKPRPFLHMDSRILHMKELKKKSGEGNSVIYDFTEKQA